LGNELFLMAKAFIAASELQLRLLPTAWALNVRGYRRFFRSSALDFLRPYTLRALLPTHTFSEQDFVATGERDYGKAVVSYAQRHRLAEKTAFLFLTEGLWGEFYSIRTAAPFIVKALYGTRYTLENLYHYEKLAINKPLVVAVNIRLADFVAADAGTDFRGLWNTRIPLEWYTRVCRSVRQALGDGVTFYLVTDGAEADLRDFIAEFSPLIHFDRENADISNLLIMSRADALVCSISSYSEWAAFLSKAPYLWYRPHLRSVGGYATIWGSLDDSPERLSVGERKYPRGIPVGSDGNLPDWLPAYLRQRRLMNLAAGDLVRGGGVWDATLGPA
jgi:hypothetical protein